MGEIDDSWETWDWWEPPVLCYMVALGLVVLGFLLFYRP